MSENTFSPRPGAIVLGFFLLFQPLLKAGTLVSEHDLLMRHAFDELADGISIDGSSNGLDGTPSTPDGPTLVDGYAGKAMSFDGVDDKLHFPTTSKVSSYKGSVSFWVKIDQSEENLENSMMIFYASAEGANADGYGGERELHVGFRTDGKIEMFIQGDSPNIGVRSNQAYKDGQWHHVLATWDVAAQTYQLFVDGSKDKRVQRNRTPRPFAASFALQAGGPSHATNRLLKGQLDDLRVYGSALTEADANAIFAGDLNSPFTSTTGAIGELGKTFSHAVTLSVDPKSLNVEGLPEGINFDADTKTIAGVPTKGGQYQVTLRSILQDDTESTQTLSLFIADGQSNQLKANHGGIVIDTNTGRVLHGLTNIASLSTISSGDQQDNYSAALAIDGNPNTISHSKEDKAANHLELDLKSPRKLHSLQIINRPDGRGNRLSQALVKLLAGDRTEIHAFPPITGAANGELLTFVPPEDKDTAQFIRIEKAVDTSHLHVAEIKVYEANENPLGDIIPISNTVEEGVRTLIFDVIDIGQNVSIELIGDLPLSLRTLDGDINLATTLDASGGTGVNLNRTRALGRLGGAHGPEARRWNDANNLGGNGPGAGATYQNAGSGASHGGLGGPIVQRTSNSFEKKNPVPSVPASTYGDREISKLLGGSSGGSSDRSGGGAGGGAIELAAGGTGKVILSPTGIIRVDGGNATGEDNTSVGGGGSGGSIRLSGTEVHNHGQLLARGGASNRGPYESRPEGETRGGNGSGGRIAIHSLGTVVPGSHDVSAGGARSPNMANLDGTHGGIAQQGTFAIIGEATSELDISGGTLTIDTSSASWHHSDGHHGLGQLEARTASLNGIEYAYKVAAFEFESVYIGADVQVLLTGVHSLSLRTQDGGDIDIDADLVANGGNGYPNTPNFSPGGRGILGGYNGGPKDAHNIGGAPAPSINHGEGPGYGSDGQNGGGGAGSGGRGGNGRGSNGGERGASYDDPTIDHLIGGSGGGAGDTSGGGAGGGAIEILSGADLSIGGTIQVNGGNTASVNRMGGAGSGGAIRLLGKDVTIRGVLNANGGSVVRATSGDQRAGAGAGGRIYVEHSGKLNIHPSAGVSNGLVAHYAFPEGIGEATIDSVTGKLANFSEGLATETAWVKPQGDLGVQPVNAINFDGIDDYVNGHRASEYGIGGAQPRTISCWVYARSFGNRRGVWHIGRFGGNRQDFSLCTNTTDNNWVIQLWGSDRGFYVANSKEQWVHFALVYDGKDVVAYANGIEAGRRDDVTLNTPDNDPLTIGAWQRGTNQHLEYFDGLIRDFRIYDRNLGADEIKNVMVDSGSLAVVHGADSRYEDAENGTVVIVPKGGPSIQLLGDSIVNHEAGEPFTDPGNKILDSNGSEIAGATAIVSELPDGTELGEFVVTYSYTDTEDRAAPDIRRVVNVIDTTAPNIELVGGDTIEVLKGAAYDEPGATATDNLDTDLVSGIFNDSPALPSEGLILRYTFDNAENPLLDEISNKAITLQGETVLTNEEGGFSGKGLSFTGAADSFAEIEAFETGGAMTIASHVFLRRYNNWQRICSFNDGNNGKNAIYIAQNGNGSWIRWKTTPGANMDYDFFETEQWIHVVTSVDAENNKKLYKDGHLILSRNNQQNGPRATRQNNWLGKSSFSTNGFLDGVLDNFMVFNRGVTDQEAFSLSKGTNSVDTSTPGEYTVTYELIDSNGNAATPVTRKVVVVDTLTKPVLTLNGSDPLNIEAGAAFADPGATAKNPSDDSVIKADVSGIGEINTNVPGTYTLLYTFTDEQIGEALPLTRNVVVADTQSPTLSLVGDSEITVLQGKSVDDPGANATDTFDQNLQVVSSASPTRNAINIMAYNKRATDEELDLASDTGIQTWTPDGSALLREGPTGKGLSIFGGAQFQTLGAGITEINEFSTIFTGLFQAKVSGEYAFGITAEDDRGAFWLDLDQDGNFETVGDRGGEHMNGSFAPGFSYVVLQPGFYKFAVAHTENVNWEAIEASFRGPEGGGPAKFTTINPSDPSQDNLWWALPSSPIDTLVPGEYDITYSAVDEAGNAATSITRKVTVVADTEPPVITLAGESSINHQIGIMYDDLGATATDNSGASIKVESSLSFPSAGLVGQWTFDDGTPSDSSGNRYHGRHHGNPVYDNTDLPAALAARGGNSINFADGDHAVVVDTGGDQDVFNLKNITVSLWVKGLTGNNATMISKEGNNDRGWAIRRNGTTKNIESRWCIAGNDHTATGDILDDGEWHHVAASWDGRVRTLYIDGEINVQSSSIGSIKPTNRLLVIGARDNGGYGMPESAWYNGKLDDIAIYNRALQPSEVAALAEGASGIDITKAGTHTITYTATDPAGNTSTATRTVVVADDPAKPVITLLGDEEITLEIGTPYVEQGVTITDSQGVAITDAEPTTTQDLLINETGVNKVQYDYLDTQGRAAKTVTRIITIVDTTAPVISLVGVEPPVMLDQDDASHSAYSDAWNDGSDGGGNGFGEWRLTANANGGFAGFFIGDSTTGSADINTTGNSFGLFGNSNVDAAANADRSFVAPLTEGQAFSIRLATNFRNGNKGLDLDNADGQSLWNFNIGKNAVSDEEDYSYADLANQGQAISLGLEYEADSIFKITVKQLAGTKVAITITRTTAGKGIESPLLNREFDLGTAIAGFGLYNAGTESGDANNLYANSLSLTSPSDGNKTTVLLNQPYSEPGATATDNSGENPIVTSSGNYPDGLIGRWTFDDGTVRDLSPFGHSAVLVGGTFSDDIPPLLGGGKSIDLSQGNHYIAVNDTSPAGNVFDSAHITVAFWVKDAKREATWESFISKRGDTGKGWQVRYNNATPRLSWTTLITNGNHNYTPNNGLNLEDNTWRHIATTYDGSEKNIYVNGMHRGRVSTTGPIEPAPDNKLIIGARDTGAIQKHSKSLIDEVAIWNRGLSATEVAGVMVGGNSVDSSKLGQYTLRYSAIDSTGNLAIATRVVEVVPNPASPIITLNGLEEITHEAGTPYNDEGATLSLADGTELPSRLIETDGLPDGLATGTFVTTYNYIDSEGNAASELKRIIHVIDTIAPVITLQGADLIVIEKGTSYTEPGFSATDSYQGTLTAKSTRVTPDLLPAARFHVRGDALEDLNDGDLVPTWPDVSTGGNKVDVSAPNNKRPTYTAAAPSLNNQPAVLFNNKELKGDIPGALDILGQHIFVVASRNDTDTSGWRYLVARDRDNRAIRATNGKWHNQGNWNNFRAADGNPGGQLRVNGNNLAGNNNTDLPAIDTGFIAHSRNGKVLDFSNIVVGNWDDALGRGWQGHIAEVIIHGPLTNEEVNAIGHGLATKYAIAETTYTDPLGDVDTTTAGDYTITYTASDEAGNTTTATRTIRVVDDASQPILVLNGSAQDTIEVGTDYTDPGATATAGIGGEVLNAKVLSEGTIDKTLLGAQTLIYAFADADGNEAQSVTRTVNVIDTTSPVITLNGEETITITTEDGFTDPGVTASDNHSVDPIITDSRTPKSNQLLQEGWQLEPQAPFFDFNNNGGLLSMKPDGSNTFTRGPGGRGIDYNGNGDFVNSDIGINLWNRYMSVLTGEFTAKVEGQYEFGIKAAATFAVFWLDLDRDGIFETAGDNGNERLNVGTEAGDKVVELLEGTYKIAIAHGVITGAPQFDVHFRTPAGAGPEVLSIINPTEPNQSGLWAISAERPFDGKTPGEYMLTYTATDISGNSSSVTRKVIVVGDETPPVITLVGEATITLKVGDSYDELGATANDDVDGNITPFIEEGGSVDTSKVGEYTLTYDVADRAGNQAVQVIRKVIVEEGSPADNYSTWLAGSGLAGLTPEQQALDADPDGDGLTNLAEYALGLDPSTSGAFMVTPDISGGSLSITFVRLKSSTDASVTYKVELATTLQDWSEANATLTAAADQTNLPDEKDSASSAYERVTATANTDVDASNGKQFLRISIEK